MISSDPISLNVQVLRRMLAYNIFSNAAQKTFIERLLYYLVSDYDKKRKHI